jgi:tricorn protease
MTPRLHAALVLLALAVPANAYEARLPRHPAPSPDGRQVAFSWQGDIWIVPAEGGAARRLTAHPAGDRFPVWSRDGRTIAFASDRHGNADVFVQPADGSAAPRRLTFASMPDQPLDFTPDGRAVLFASRRDETILRTPGLYTVPVAGGTAALAQSALGHWAAYSPDGRALAFVRGGTPWTRRGYRGAANRELWLREPGGEYRKLTDFDGDDDCPTWLPDGRLVFLSARSGRKNVFVLPREGGAAAPLTRHDGSDVRFPRAAADGSIVAYEFEDAIWVVPSAGGTPRRLSIDVPADMVVNPLERKTSRDGATELAVSPDGKLAAIVVAGDVFVTAIRSKDEQEITPPPTVQVTATPARERDVVWSPDGKRLVFASARSGNLDLFAARRGDEARDWTENFEFPVTALAAGPENEAKPLFAPDGKTLAYVRGKGDLLLMDADGGNVRTLFRHWSAPQVAFSPDGRFLAYAQEDQEHNSEIWLVPVAGGEPYNVSRHPDEDGAPAFSPDGRRLVWLSKRHANTLDVWSVWLTREDHERTLEAWLALFRDEKNSAPAKDDPAVAGAAPAAAAAPGAAPAKDKGRKPAARDGAGTAAGEKKDDAGGRPEKKLPAVKVDFDRLYERAAALTELRGDEESPLVADGGKRIVFVAEPEGERDVYSVRWDGKDEKRLTTGGRQPQAVVLDAEGKTIFYLDKAGAVQRVGLDAKAGDPVPFTARYEVDQQALRAEVFAEGWGALDEYFYDPAFHGTDWRAQYAKYRPWALAASSPDDFADVMNLMFDELNASHLGYRPKAKEGEATGFIGALFEPAPDGTGVIVREVLDDSPAARQDVKLLPGERLVGVGGRPVEADTDVYALFADSAGQRLPLQFEGKDGATRTAVVTPVTLSAERALRYAQWVRQRRAIVAEASGGRLGYIHIEGMDIESFETFERDLYAAAHGKEGLIIDVRTNGGGWTADYLLAVLQVRRHAYTVPRDASKDTRAYPQDRLPLAAWTKPAATLCNEESYSNAEIFSNAFQRLGRGPVVGTRTFGAVISTGGTTTLDGALVRLPTRGWYMAGSGENQENRGAIPDIEVAQPPQDDLAAGRDTQLVRTVDVLLKEIPGDPRRTQW